MKFPTNWESIDGLMKSYDPSLYAKTRNFGDGNVSRLSPYISRGVISTRQVYENLKARKYPFTQIEKFIQELAWRDYWQLIWIEKGKQIDSDLKHEQKEVENYGIPQNIEQGQTGVRVVDDAVLKFYETGYLHNHMRMYIAAMACNNGKSHWKIPAQWMFYHLLDADWASNALSWQWVAGSNSNKKYIANQANINKYFSSSQENTFLDKTYEEIAQMPCPKELQDSSIPQLKTSLPKPTKINIDSSKPSLLYNEYNLDPNWRKDMDANRILILDPARFKQYPMSSKTIDFILNLSKNIKNIQTYVGSQSELVEEYALDSIYFKEHPLNTDYSGTEDAREWLSTVKGYYPSFFAYWNRCRKELKY